jgi:hypothetical protein
MITVDEINKTNKEYYTSLEDKILIKKGILEIINYLEARGGKLEFWSRLCKMDKGSLWPNFEDKFTFTGQEGLIEEIISKSEKKMYYTLVSNYKQIRERIITVLSSLERIQAEKLYRERQDREKEIENIQNINFGNV